MREGARERERERERDDSLLPVWNVLRISYSGVVVRHEGGGT